MSSEKAKVAVKSKTVWTNLLMALLPLIPNDSIQDAFHNNPEILVPLFAMVNILLRFVTSEPVQLK